MINPDWLLDRGWQVQYNLYENSLLSSELPSDDIIVN